MRSVYWGMNIITSPRTSLLHKSIAPLVLLAGFWLAQTSIGQCAPIPDHPRVNQVKGRAENQQDRIAQGVKNGSLTPGESARLEARAAALKTEERGMRAADGGHLTKRDQATLNQQQNKLSGFIYREKHD